ncbi:hypothetical protein [Lactiplantibacillus plantarum]|uniref:hypothetical protein n=1 Tax=Lactiplantibacillus plantarum TaxID=1590 RepID=UPI001FBB6320|nr:hypothetical protein [Lactiplantibacillus plantarum]
MNYRNLLVLPLAVLLVGCSSPTHQDSKTSQTTTSAKATVSSTQKKTKATSSTSSRTQTATTRSSKTARERASAANRRSRSSNHRAYRRGCWSTIYHVE